LGEINKRPDEVQWWTGTIIEDHVQMFDAQCGEIASDIRRPQDPIEGHDQDIIRTCDAHLLAEA